MTAPDNCVIRAAALADLDSVHALEQTCFAADTRADAQSRRSLRYLITQARADFMLALDAGRVVADVIVLYRNNSGIARLYSIAVDEAARGRGLAGVLLGEAEAAARRRGCRALRAEARLSNRASRALFARAGYRESARLPGYYSGNDGTYEDGIRLEKILT